MITEQLFVFAAHTYTPDYHTRRLRGDGPNFAVSYNFRNIYNKIYYTIDSETNVYVKIENLLDQKYHLSDTAGTYGRTLSMGMSLNF